MYNFKICVKDVDKKFEIEVLVLVDDGTKTQKNLDILKGILVLYIRY